MLAENVSCAAGGLQQEEFYCHGLPKAVRVGSLSKSLRAETRIVKEFMQCARSISASLRGVLDSRRFDRAECTHHRETGTAGGCFYPGDSALRDSAR